MADSVDAAPRIDASSTTVALENVNTSSGLTEGTVNKSDESENRYRMDYKRRGKFIIINNKTFSGMNERTGTDVDAENLRGDFRKLGFEVELNNNQTVEQMSNIMSKVALEDHSDCDAFGVAVLSHGENGILYGTDKTIAVNDFVEPIKSCKTLAGKPKIFLFQACRGNETDAGVKAEDDFTDDPKSLQPAKYILIPREADFIYAYSTVPGYYSWRNGKEGSWFVQALHQVLPKYQYSLDFVTLLTRVNHAVALNFVSNSSFPWINGKKQVPSVVSMLTKDLYFHEKK